MKLKLVRKIFLYVLVLMTISFGLVLVIYPERTINRVLADLSKIEFKLMGALSHFFPKNSDAEGALLTMVSHRGVVRNGSIENSHQSIIDTLKAEFKEIEIDISFSSDFIPFVYHGPGLDLVGRKGLFSDLSSSEIKRCKLINGEYVVTLMDFCNLYTNKFDRVYLDIKSDNSDHKIKSRMIVEAIGGNNANNIVLIGYPWKIMREVKTSLPDIRMGIEQKGAIANFILNGDMVSLHYRNQFSYAEYKLAKLLGLDVVTWTVNDTALLKEYSKIYRMQVLTDLHAIQNILWSQKV